MATSGEKITRVYCMICTEEDGTEGVPSGLLPGGLMVPLFCTRERNIETLKPYGQDAANKTGRPVRIVQFTGQTIIGTIEPESWKGK